MKIQHLLLAAHLVFLSLPLSAQSTAKEHWVGTWAASQQPVEDSARSPTVDLKDATLRQIIHVSLGGSKLRLHLSNAFGTQPLHILATHLALPDTSHRGSIHPASDTLVLFDRSPGIWIPAGAEYLSDPISFRIEPDSDLAITLQYGDAPVGQTTHSGSRATSYLAHATPAAVDLPGATTFEHWFQISGVDVAADRESFAVVTLGDSITDGRGSTTDGNDRWPDLLSGRMLARGHAVGILNQGIGGNRILDDGLGPNVLARLDRDVLAQPGVKYLIVLEGVNDLGTSTRINQISLAEHTRLVERLKGAFRQIVLRAHAAGISVIGGTITPYGGSAYYHPDRINEEDRQSLNRWILKSGTFDGAVDFATALADQNDRQRLNPIYDSGDHLHPSPLGYKVMADTATKSLLAGPLKHGSSQRRPRPHRMPSESRP